MKAKRGSTGRLRGRAALAACLGLLYCADVLSVNGATGGGAKRSFPGTVKGGKGLPKPLNTPVPDPSKLPGPSGKQPLIVKPDDPVVPPKDPPGPTVPIRPVTPGPKPIIPIKPVGPTTHWFPGADKPPLPGLDDRTPSGRDNQGKDGAHTQATPSPDGKVALPVIRIDGKSAIEAHRSRMRDLFGTPDLILDPGNDPDGIAFPTDPLPVIGVDTLITPGNGKYPLSLPIDPPGGGQYPISLPVDPGPTQPDDGAGEPTEPDGDPATASPGEGKTGPADKPDAVQPQGERGTTEDIGKPERGDGDADHPRDTWWVSYLAGRAAMAAGRYDEARRAFEACLAARSGLTSEPPGDSWSVRPLGSGFPEAYFPNREIGICHYHLGDTGKAIRFLEASIRQAPSGRGKHYLNLARRQQLQGAEIRAPEIAFDRASVPSWTSDHECRVAGTAQGRGLVRRIRVNNEEQFIELAEPSRRFGCPVSLKPGPNVIRVETEDLLGNRAARTTTVIADWEPPQLAISSVKKDKDLTVVTAVCQDDQGLRRVAVGGKEFFRHSEGHVRNEVPVTVRFSSKKAPVMEVADMAGNCLRAPLQGTDRLRPALKFSFPQKVIEVFDEEFFLDGNADDGGGIAGVSVNGEPLLSPKGQGSVRVYFARRLPLDPGTNCFDIVVTDLGGNRSVRQLKIVRRTPQYMEQQYRLSVGIPPLLSGQYMALGRQVKRLMEQELTREPVRFRLLERDEGWGFILREQDLSLSDLADPGAALQIGKMLPAEFLLMGRLTPEPGGMSVLAKVVRSNDGTVVFADDVYFEGEAADLEYLVSGLAMKIEQRFPAVRGKLLDVAGQKAILDVGAERGIGPGTSFIVVSQTRGPDTRRGKVCMAGDRFVELMMESVEGDRGTARVLPPDGARAIAGGDYVVAR